MSEDIEMMDSYPSINLSKRNGVTQGEFDPQPEEAGQGDSYSVGGAAETARKRRRVESDNVPGNPSSFEMVDEPSVHAGAPFGEDAGELEGNLVAPGTPILSGGYANIFLGIWRSPDGTLRDVAVKILKPIRPTSMSSRSDLITLQQRREKRLKREVAVWTRLDHRNIHPLLGFRTQPEPCLVSPWCQNGNLVSYLDNNPNLSRPDKIQLIVQTASGLAFLHSQAPPICHADIKPENVLMNGLSEATLSDFGLSRVIQEIDASTGFTTGDGPKGSHRYMAPELFEEENPKPTLETDIYAFGGLTLAVMSGSPPFPQINAPARIMHRIVRGEHPKPEEHPELRLNDPLWSLMARCWAREPEMRPAMNDVKVELKSLHVSTGIPFSWGPGGPMARFRTVLNDLEQGKWRPARFMFDAYHDGPDHCGEWVSKVTVTWIARDLANRIPVGTAREGRGFTKAQATDTASRMMLDLFGAHMFVAGREKKK